MQTLSTGRMFGIIDIASMSKSSLQKCGAIEPVVYTLVEPSSTSCDTAVSHPGSTFGGKFDDVEILYVVGMPLNRTAVPQMVHRKIDALANSCSMCLFTASQTPCQTLEGKKRINPKISLEPRSKKKRRKLAQKLTEPWGHVCFSLKATAWSHDP